jgi:hypothetical protein
VVLEQAVKEDVIAFYGLTSTGWDDLAGHIAAADDAAATVWGRRKRCNLKALMAPFNMAEQHAAREKITYHGTEAVSLLELAARRSMLVLADRPTLWHGPWGLCDIIETTNPTSLKAQALLASRLPNPWPTLPVAVQAWGVVSSMAGVTSAVVNTSPSNCILFQQAMEQPDIVDMAHVLQAS